MEWTNDRAIEFLELYQTEPSIWDLRMDSHKNRSAVNDAWLRIKEGLTFPTTVEELKRKKDSLMGYYRIHLNRYKKSLKSGAGEVYSTSWFAFDIMHSFLKPIYDRNATLHTEPSPSSTATSVAGDLGEEEELIIEATPLTEETAYRNIRRPSASASRKLRKRTCPEFVAAKKQVDGAFEYLGAVADKHNLSEMDEYDLFGKLIATKIRRINDADERENLMHSIQDMIFHSIMKNKV